MTDAPGYGPRKLNVDVPSAARAYDYLLGGSHNFRPDRDFANQLQQVVPWLPNLARLNRSFLRRAIKLILSRGVHQFLDLGSGIPTVGNVHEIAQQTVPDARVVYVDYEPVAYQHAVGLLDGNPHATIIHADAREPASILEHPKTREMLDFSQPIGLLMVGILLFIGPQDRPAELVRTYRRTLASDSYLAISHISDEEAPPEQRDQVATLVAAYLEADEHVFVRSREEISSWFDGMEIVPPGVTLLPDWQPEHPEEAGDAARPLGYGGVARQP